MINGEDVIMCGRFTLRAPAAEVATLFDLIEATALDVRWNIAPTQPVLCIGENGGRRAAGFMRWGLVPDWEDDPKTGSRLINARCETLAEKPTFREAFRRRRCLIPADGFYEWKAEGKRKVPYLFHRPDRKPFAFAGLWERRQREGEQPLLTCTIITTAANGLVRPLHDRMPVILTREQWTEWLKPGALANDVGARLFHSVADNYFELAPTDPVEMDHRTAHSSVA
jgi:putative SOS response-associated peptidase YedK